MSDTPTIRDRFERLVRAMTRTYPIGDETKLGSGGLEMDSLDLLELRLETEEEFSIEIRDDEIDQPGTGTFGGMLALIERKRADLTIG